MPQGRSSRGLTTIRTRDGYFSVVKTDTAPWLGTINKLDDPGTQPGFVTGAFVAGYGASRIIVEFFRSPDAHIGYLAGTDWLTMGMVLSLPMVLAGLRIMAAARRRAALPA